ncbi:phospholipid/cholesterol/gamma-HCH transport system substrate-binding protein [Nocardioides thalensis]|uniref:Phospholipid/cholesterol/gamma-HCH transport system substrate-binding protein n=1 Tax=Nocardioides thalensis TaxID=1914755 RepID=A0A853C3E9_9ACTN|nr:MCE family protein [Nocardioides thalensis]NYJ01108.1 phospholipid/cholesterol/gamma-HCH transport system substrate-binding protein [Nocardioides thalensis]
MKGLRTITGAVLAGAVVVTATGCGTTMRDLPIPGTGVSGDTVQLNAEFDDALNLAEGAPVKVNGVDSGKVTGITVDDFVAHVTMDLKEDAQVREGATARLRYTTPLGELFIDVDNPSEGEVLADDATLELPETETAPTVEDALAQASLLINGGGLDQLRIITDELNTALGGNEENIRGLLDRANTFLTEANATTGSIDAVLNSLNSLSSTLSAREDTINRAMREIRPAAAVLRRATPDLTRLLQAVERFSSAANDTVNATRTQLLNLLSEVEPVLAELAKNRGRFAAMLRSIQRAADVAKQAIPTEFLNVNLDLHIDGITGGGPLGDLLGLLDTLGVVLPVDELNDILEDLGLGGLLDGILGDGGLLGGGRQSDPGRTGGAGGGDDGSGGADGGLLGLDGLLGGLTGGGA